MEQLQCNEDHRQKAWRQVGIEALEELCQGDVTLNETGEKHIIQFGRLVEELMLSGVIVQERGLAVDTD